MHDSDDEEANSVGQFKVGGARRVFILDRWMIVSILTS